MERAAGSIRRKGAVLWSMGSSYPELNLIISELKNFKALTKAARDSQNRIFRDICNWSVNKESRIIHEHLLFIHELNNQWIETQSQLAAQISEFRRHYELILEGEKSIDAARSKLAECEVAEQKAKKKLKKIQRKDFLGDISAITNKVAECERLREIAQAEVSQKVQEVEAAKIIRMKESLIKLSEAYIAYGNKCVCVFEGHKELAGTLPDMEQGNLHEVVMERTEVLEGILEKTVLRLRRCTDLSSSQSQHPQNRNLDPPPPYAATLYYPVPPVNPYYIASGSQEAASNRQETNQNALDPDVTDEELAGAMSSAKI